MYLQFTNKMCKNILMVSQKNTPQYFQATTHFQEECMKSAKKSFDAAITMQQEFAQNLDYLQIFLTLQKL